MTYLSGHKEYDQTVFVVTPYGAVTTITNSWYIPHIRLDSDFWSWISVCFRSFHRISAFLSILFCRDFCNGGWGLSGWPTANIFFPTICCKFKINSIENEKMPDTNQNRKAMLQCYLYGGLYLFIFIKYDVTCWLNGCNCRCHSIIST